MNDEEVMNTMREITWKTQVDPKFAEAKIDAVNVAAARQMFDAAFASGWESHKAHLTKQMMAHSHKGKGYQA